MPNSIPRHRPLGARERQYICSYISSLLPVARRSANHPMRRIARSQISWAMWRWTADGVTTSNDEVQQDAYKYDVEVLPCTRGARLRALTTKKGLRHEHIVPRMVLADSIIERSLSTKEIHDFLSSFCEAIIVTKEEDSRLQRSSMPDGWNFDTGCRYARYREAGLFNEIEFK